MNLFRLNLVEHALLAGAAQRARAARLGVAITVQHPWLYTHGAEMVRRWGAHRAACVMPLRSWLADGALVSVDTALALLPGDKNLRFVRAGALAVTGATDAAADELRALVAEHPTWEVAIRGFADKGLMTLPDGVTIDGILERHDP